MALHASNAQPPGALAAPEAPHPGAPGSGLRERLGAYRNLAKLQEYGAFLAVPLAWTLLDAQQAGDPRNLVVLGLILLLVVGIRSAESALDDVAGMRDGIDQITYGDGPGGHRGRSRKPLLDGRLSEAQAVRYAQFAVATGVAAFVLALALVGFRPLWVPLATLLAAALVVSYSWGPKLSYLGGHDVVVVLGVALTLAVSYGTVTGRMTWVVAVEGLTLGLWLSVPMAFGNLADLEADRGADRRTMAVLLAPRAYRRYVIGLVLTPWALLALALAAGAMPALTVALATPCLAVQLLALERGFRRERPLWARRLCHVAYRVGWVGLAVANLVAVR